MQQMQTLQELQSELTGLEIVEEIYLDADNDRLSVKFQSGFDFRIDQVLRDYPEIDFIARKEREDKTNSYIGFSN